MTAPMVSTTDRPYQLLPPLTAEQRDLLRQSIRENGVLDAVVFDENGEVLDGHHRVEIAEELGIEYPRRVIEDLDEPGKHMYALTVNVARRQLDDATRGKLIAQMRLRGMSIRQIAKATGLSKTTVARNVDQLSHSGQLDQPKRITGTDGKSRPSTRPAAPDLKPAILDDLAAVGADGTIAWQIAFRMNSTDPDEKAVTKALAALAEARKVCVVGRTDAGALWALAEYATKTPEPSAADPAAPVDGSGSSHPDPFPGEGQSDGLPSAVAAAEESPGGDSNVTGAAGEPEGPDFSDLDRQLDAQMEGTDQRFRRNFSAALVKAIAIWQFDEGRIAQAYAADFDQEIVPTLEQMEQWCTRVRAARHGKSGLRVVKGGAK